MFDSMETKSDALKLISEIPEDTRTPEQVICGDPLPGRSAFDLINEGMEA